MMDDNKEIYTPVSNKILEIVSKNDPIAVMINKKAIHGNTFRPIGSILPDVIYTKYKNGLEIVLSSDLNTIWSIRIEKCGGYDIESNIDSASIGDIIRPTIKRLIKASNDWIEKSRIDCIMEVLNKD